MYIVGVKENDRLPAVVFTAENLKKAKMQNIADNESKYDVENGGNSGKLSNVVKTIVSVYISKLG